MSTQKIETRGRKLIGDTRRKAMPFMIDANDLELIAALGAGNRSNGLHVLCEIYRKEKEAMQTLNAGRTYKTIKTYDNLKPIEGKK